MLAAKSAVYDSFYCSILTGEAFGALNCELNLQPFSVFRTSYQLNITISYWYYCKNTYLFFPKKLEESKFRQISNLAFIVPRPRRSFGQVVSDNKLRHPRLLLAWVSENIKKTFLNEGELKLKRTIKEIKTAEGITLF